MPNHRLQGRTARPEASSRKGRFWDTEIEPVFEGPNGNFTAKDFYSQFGNASKLNRGEAKATRFGRRSCACGGKIDIHADGKAICNNPHCSTVFNDGGNTEGMIQVTDIYDSGKKEVLVLERRERDTLLPTQKWVTKHFLKRSSL
jgi:hypothetical protein